jgi:hypothetical protein
MVLRFTRYLIGGIVLVIVTIGVLAGFEYYFPPTYEATAKLANLPSKIIVQIVPMHPYLAEYKRMLVLRKAGSPDQQVEMFPDTGGYSRTQLYKLPDGKFLVSSFFDAFVIDLSKHSIVAYTGTAAYAGTYLGAFDNTRQGNSEEWKFIDASHSPEQELVAQGG